MITAAGQRAQTVLPDGSKVWLNASSKIVYHNSLWSSDRQIDLSGEAYFEVSHDKHAPFIVNSKQIKTCVLGTKFNVRAREEENRVVTTLLQGLVTGGFSTNGREWLFTETGTDIECEYGYLSGRVD